MRKAISVIKNRFHSGGRQQPAEDLPPCRGADSRRHRIRSHYLKGTRGRQVVDAIGICRCEPGTGIATIPKAYQSARARIVATTSEMIEGHAVAPDRAAFKVSSTTLNVVPQLRGSSCDSANHELGVGRAPTTTPPSRRFTPWTSMSAAPMRRLSVRKPRNTQPYALGRNGRNTQWAQGFSGWRATGWDHSGWGFVDWQ
jgi:hypothetical protein